LNAFPADDQVDGASLRLSLQAKRFQAP
jgi:hypothetical protein